MSLVSCVTIPFQTWRLAPPHLCLLCHLRLLLLRLCIAPRNAWCSNGSSVLGVSAITLTGSCWACFLLVSVFAFPFTPFVVCHKLLVGGTFELHLTSLPIRLTPLDWIYPSPSSSTFLSSLATDLSCVPPGCCVQGDIMSSGSGQSSVPSKAINIPSQPSQSFQIASYPGIETASQRRTQAFLGAGSSSKNLSSPRNHQTRKNQHKRHRRPRLDDEDVFAESVCFRPVVLMSPLVYYSLWFPSLII